MRRPDFKDLHPLVRGLVTQPTLARYGRRFRLFVDFVQVRGGGSIWRRSRAKDIDKWLVMYVLFLYDSNGTISEALCAQAAVEFYFDTRMAKTRRIMEGWRKRQPINRRKFMPFEIMVFVVCGFFTRGMVEHAVAVLLMFAGYLRISEMERLLVEDVEVGSKSEPIVLTLKVTKTMRNAAVYIRDEIFVGPLRFWLDLLIDSLRLRFGRNVKHQKLFSFSSTRFRKDFKWLLQDLGLGHVGWTPHSLRHGAASYAMRCGKTVQVIMEEGRWRAQSSARHYIQHVAALFSAWHIPRSIRDQAHFLADDIEVAFIEAYEVGLNL